MKVLTPTSRRWRLFRAGIFALVATQLAALGHLMAGGAVPDGAQLITVTVFLGGSVSGFGHRRRNTPQIVGALLASQLAFHLAFALTAHSETTEPAMGAGAGRMVAFHVLAAVVAGWVMAAGESTLFRLFSALHRVLLVAAPRPAIGLSPGWTALVPEGTVGIRLSACELSAGSRRGPPRGPRSLPA